MMRTVFVILALILPYLGLTQDIKNVKKQTRFSYEEYYVLKDDKKIKHGKYYKMTHFKGPYLNLTEFKEDTITSGAYNQNKKTGIWNYYDKGLLIGRGRFSDDKKVGAWQYFWNNKLICEFDHSAGALLYQMQSDSEYEILQPSGETRSKLERAPVYPDFYPLVYEKISYPEEALRLGIVGKVLVSFVVGKDGTTKDFKIEKDIGSNCGEELLSALKVLDKGWLPGLKNGEPVAVRHYVVAEFKLFENGYLTIIVEKF
jgi:hypothetical protein